MHYSKSNSRTHFARPDEAPQYRKEESLQINTATQQIALGSILSPEARLTVTCRHGTATTGVESWGDTYVPALKDDGYTACYVTIPNRSMDDMQVNAEFVAYAMHYVSAVSGGLPVAVISHSQGGPNTQWALQFWPSTRNVTKSFVALAPDFTGIELPDSLLDKVCETGICQAAVWQQSAGSEYNAAASGFQAQVPTTSIYTDVSERRTWVPT